MWMRTMPSGAPRLPDRGPTRLSKWLCVLLCSVGLLCVATLAPWQRVTLHTLPMPTAHDDVVRLREALRVAERRLESERNNTR